MLQKTTFIFPSQCQNKTFKVSILGKGAFLMKNHEHLTTIHTQVPTRKGTASGGLFKRFLKPSRRRL